MATMLPHRPRVTNRLRQFLFPSTHRNIQHFRVRFHEQS